MAWLYYANAVDRRPDQAMRATHDALADFSHFLRRAKAYVENARPELSWTLLGVPIAFRPTAAEHDPARWEARLASWFSARHASVRVRGDRQKTLPAVVIARYAASGIAVVATSLDTDTVVDLAYGDARRPLTAVIGSVPPHALTALQNVWVRLDDVAGEEETPEAVFEEFLDDDAREVFELFEVQRTETKNRDHYRRQQRIKIVDRDPDRRALCLERLPSRPVLCIRPSTVVIERQQHAVERLRDRPLPEHRPLVRLFEARDQSAWPPLEPANVDRWFVLTDAARPGTAEQREFVRRALATPDFVLLEGPPGSGKTTAIEELILQLVARGQRVLLCASTHVAVDHIIDLLKRATSPHRDGVLLVRIGDEGRLTSAVAIEHSLAHVIATERRALRERLGGLADRSRPQSLMLDALRAEGGMDDPLQRLWIECAQVVCGTTNGVVKYRSALGADDVTPPFGTLILDEASKTPFAEFLVPALLANRWIVVGDRRQLSPYVDEEWLATNVDAALIQGGGDSARAARVSLDVFRAAESHDGRSLIVSSDDEGERQAYLTQARSVFPQADDVVALDIQDGSSPPMETLMATRVVVGSSASIRRVVDALPLDTRIVRADPTDVVSRRHAARGVDAPEPETWAGEVAWRLSRDYELRLLPKSPAGASDTSNGWGYAEAVRALIPAVGVVEDRGRVDRALDGVRRVALPSVLEALQEGVGDAGRNVDHALARGLPAHVLQSRLMRLTHQHRMHPAIAAFPREHIYNSEALRTPDDLADRRAWDYGRYGSRVVWVDVRGQAGPRNQNEAEAETVRQEIEHFVEWARRKPREDGRPWEVAVLSFYRGQLRSLRRVLAAFTGERDAWRHFTVHDGHREVVVIDLCTVDRFQGHEADVVLLSMVKSHVTSFLASPNRLNVAITRARYQLVVIGNCPALKRGRRPSLVKLLASTTPSDVRFG